MINPDAPLGHHIGQDVGHISSSVVGASLRLDSTIIEASTFYGKEPEPTKVDLPIGTPNSYAARLIQEMGDFTAMISFANVHNPHEDHHGDLQRYSGSVYLKKNLTPTWNFNNSFIFGLIKNYDHTSSLTSWGEEFLFNHGPANIWGRVEILQRTANELRVASSDEDKPEWVTAMTLGYTHEVYQIQEANLRIGAAITRDVLPGKFRKDYGGDPWSAKVFLQLSGMKMWDL